MSRVDEFKKVQEESLALFVKKNNDYGDTFTKYGPVGVLVRLGDKIGRLMSITGHKIQMVQSESLRDTLIDLHNYSAMAIMLIDSECTTASKIDAAEKKPDARYDETRHRKITSSPIILHTVTLVIIQVELHRKLKNGRPTNVLDVHADNNNSRSP